MTNFTILPNNLFYTKDDTKSIFKLTNNHKTILVLDYLHINTNRLGITKFTISDIITSYGFKPRTGRGNINEQIRNILIQLQKNDVIDIVGDIDLSTVNINKLISCNYKGISKNNDGDNVEFTTVDYDICHKILAYRDDNIDNVKLLFHYCYLACRMHKRKKGESLSKDGGRAEVCYPSYEDITNNTNLKSDTIKQYNDILLKNNVLRIGNCGLYYYRSDKNKIQKESPNFYTFVSDEDLKIQNDKDTNWYNNLKSAMDFYKNSNDDKVFSNSREYKSNKSVSNYIARIEQLEKEMKATKEQIKKKNSLLQSKNMNTNITDLKVEIEKRYKNIIQMDDAYNLDLDICEDWKDYLPGENEMIDWEQKVYTVTDYQNILKKIDDIEKEMNIRLKMS